MSEDQREHPRMEMCFSVEVRYEGHAPQVLCTRDLSHGGAFILKGTDPLPPVGAMVTVKAQKPEGDGADPPVIKARVVRKDDDGIGVQFIS
jgi:hypothetical protein